MLRLLLSAILCALTYVASAQVPPLRLADIEGKEHEVSQLIGQGKVSVLSFFATWCKPCMRELSAINEVYDEWQTEAQFEFIAVSTDQGADTQKVKPLARANAWPWLVLLDSNEALKRSLNVTALPTVIVLNAQGKVVYRHTGYRQGSEQELLDAIIKHQP